MSATPGISPPPPLRSGRSWHLTSEVTFRPSATGGLPAVRAHIEDWIQRRGQIIERLTLSHGAAIPYTLGYAWPLGVAYASIQRLPSSVESLSAPELLPSSCRKPNKLFGFLTTLTHLPTTQRVHDALLAAIGRLPGAVVRADTTDALGRRGTTIALGDRRMTFVQETGAILEVAAGPLTQTFIKADVVTGAPHPWPPTRIGNASPGLALVARGLTRSC